MGIENDNHEKLVLAYLDYFKTYDAYYNKRSVRKYYAHQKNVRRLVVLTKLINKELQEEFHDRGAGANIKNRRQELKRDRDAKQKQNKGKDV